MNNIDVKEHFRTRWTWKGICDGKEFLVLDMIRIVNIVYFTDRPARDCLTVCSSIHWSSSTNFLRNFVLVRKSFFHNAAWIVPKVVTYDLEVYGWAAKSGQAQMPIRKYYIMSLIPQFPDCQTNSITRERWGEYGKQCHVPFYAEPLEIRLVKVAILLQAFQ
jgi:hypothetical protein